MRIIDKDLIGDWRFRRTDVAETLARDLRDYMLNVERLEEATAEWYIASLLSLFKVDPDTSLIAKLSLNADATLENQEGKSGVWTANGSTLVLKIGGVVVYEGSYRVAESGLALTLNRDQTLRLIEAEIGDGLVMTPELWMYFNIMFRDDGVVSYFFEGPLPGAS